MKYPIEITQEELAEYGINIGGDDAGVKKFLKYLHQALYESVLLVTHRSWRLKVMEKYKADLEEPLKDILLDIALAIDSSGDFNGLWDGKSRLDNGGFEIKNLQERLTAVIPPMVWNAIFALEPNLLFNGGEI